MLHLQHVRTFAVTFEQLLHPSAWKGTEHRICRFTNLEELIIFVSPQKNLNQYTDSDLSFLGRLHRWHWYYDSDVRTYITRKVAKFMCWVERNNPEWKPPFLKVLKDDQSLDRYMRR
jgi:hypothetical protein